MLVRGLVNKMMDLPSSPLHPSHSPDPVVPTEYSLFMEKYLNFNITHAGSVRGMESRLIASPSVPLPQSANLIRHSLGKGTSFDIHLLCSFRFLWFYIFIFPFPLSFSFHLSFFLSFFLHLVLAFVFIRTRCSFYGEALWLYISSNLWTLRIESYLLGPCCADPCPYPLPGPPAPRIVSSMSRITTSHYLMSLFSSIITLQFIQM